MLFRKDMDPRCAYCQRGQQINEREVAVSYTHLTLPTNREV